jgi:hypothetical protein
MHPRGSLSTGRRQELLPVAALTPSYTQILDLRPTTQLSLSSDGGGDDDGGDDGGVG